MPQPPDSFQWGTTDLVHLQAAQSAQKQHRQQNGAQNNQGMNLGYSTASSTMPHMPPLAYRGAGGPPNYQQQGQQSAGYMFPQYWQQTRTSISQPQSQSTASHRSREVFNNQPNQAPYQFPAQPPPPYSAGMNNFGQPQSSVSRISPDLPQNQPKDPFLSALLGENTATTNVYTHSQPSITRRSPEMHQSHPSQPPYHLTSRQPQPSAAAPHHGLKPHSSHSHSLPQATVRHRGPDQTNRTQLIAGPPQSNLPASHNANIYNQTQAPGNQYYDYQYKQQGQFSRNPQMTAFTSNTHNQPFPDPSFQQARLQSSNRPQNINTQQGIPRTNATQGIPTGNVSHGVPRASVPQGMSGQNAHPGMLRVGMPERLQSHNWNPQRQQDPVANYLMQNGEFQHYMAKFAIAQMKKRKISEVETDSAEYGTRTKTFAVSNQHEPDDRSILGRWYAQPGETTQTEIPDKRNMTVPVQHPVTNVPTTSNGERSEASVNQIPAVEQNLPGTNFTIKTEIPDLAYETATNMPVIDKMPTSTSDTNCAIPENTHRGVDKERENVHEAANDANSNINHPPKDSSTRRKEYIDMPLLEPEITHPDPLTSRSQSGAPITSIETGSITNEMTNDSESVNVTEKTDRVTDSVNKSVTSNTHNLNGKEKTDGTTVTVGEIGALSNLNTSDRSNGLGNGAAEATSSHTTGRKRGRKPGWCKRGAKRGRGGSFRGKEPTTTTPGQDRGKFMVKRARGRGRGRGKGRGSLSAGIQDSLNQVLNQENPALENFTQQLRQQLRQCSEDDLNKETIPLKMFQDFIVKMTEKKSDNSDTAVDKTSDDKAANNREEVNETADKTEVDKTSEVKVKIEEDKSLVVKIPKLSFKDYKRKGKLTLHPPKPKIKLSPEAKSSEERETANEASTSSKVETCTEKPSPNTEEMTIETSTKSQAETSPRLSAPTANKGKSSRNTSSDSKEETRCKDPSLHRVSSLLPEDVSDNQEGSVPDNPEQTTNTDSESDKRNVQSDSVESPIHYINPTHAWRIVQFHGVHVFQMITEEGRFFLMAELLKKCFTNTVTDWEERQSTRQRILVIKEKVLDVPFKPMDCTFHSPVEKYLILIKCRRRKIEKLSIINEENANRLYHFFFGDQANCANGCIVYKTQRKFKTKGKGSQTRKDDEQPSTNGLCKQKTSESTNTSQTVCTSVMVTQPQCGSSNSSETTKSETTDKQHDVSVKIEKKSPKADKKMKDRIKLEKSKEKEPRNIFHWLGKETMSKSEVIDLTNEDSDTEAGYETDRTLPYQEDSMDGSGFKKKMLGKSSPKKRRTDEIMEDSRKELSCKRLKMSNITNEKSKDSPTKSVLSPKLPETNNLKNNITKEKGKDSPVKSDLGPSCKVPAETNLQTESVNTNKLPETHDNIEKNQNESDSKLVISNILRHFDSDDIIEINLSDNDDDSSPATYSVLCSEKSNNVNDRPSLFSAFDSPIEHMVQSKSDLQSCDKSSTVLKNACAVSSQKLDTHPMVSVQTADKNTAEELCIESECTNITDKVREAFDSDEPADSNESHTGIRKSLCSVEPACGVVIENVAIKEKNNQSDQSINKHTVSECAKDNTQTCEQIQNKEKLPPKSKNDKHQRSEKNQSSKDSHSRGKSKKLFKTKKPVPPISEKSRNDRIEPDSTSESPSEQKKNDNESRLDKENDSLKENIDNSKKSAQKLGQEKNTKKEIAYLDDVFIAKKEFLAKTTKKLQDCIDKANQLQDYGRQKGKRSELYKDLDEISKPVFSWSMSLLKKYQNMAEDTDDCMLRDQELEQAYAELENNRLIL